MIEQDPYLLNGAKPGLYPDPIMPLVRNGCVPYAYASLRAVWIDFLPFEKSGEVKISVYDEEGKLICENTLEVEVMPFELPSQEPKYGNFFHCDAIADYYDLEVFSEKHFEYIERWLKVAREHGQNMIFLLCSFYS